MQIGEKITYRRKELGLTLENASKGICSISYLSKVEHNRLVPKEDILEMLCTRLKLNIKDLMRDDLEIYIDSLKVIYGQISVGEYFQAKEQLNRFKHLSISIDPNLSTAYYIVLLYFHIVTRDGHMSAKIREKVIEREHFTSGEIEIWYFKCLGYYEYIYGDISESANKYYKADEKANNLHVVDAQLQYLLGLVNTRLSLTLKSFFHTEKALEVYNQKVNFKKIIDCKLLLGINHNKIGQYRIAENYFLSITESLERINDKKTLAKVYHNLGYLYSLDNQPHKSILFLERAKEIKSSIEVLSTIYLLAYENKKLGEVSKALSLCEEGLSLSDVSEPYYIFKLLILKHSISNKLNEESFITKLEKEIIPYYITKDPNVASECLFLLAKIMSGQNKYKAATSYYDKAININFQTSRKELLY